VLSVERSRICQAQTKKNGVPIRPAGVDEDAVVRVLLFAEQGRKGLMLHLRLSKGRARGESTLREGVKSLKKRGSDEVLGPPLAAC